MRKSTRFLGLALVGAVALLLPLTADAACGTSLSFGMYYSHVTNTDNGPSLRSNFWLLNAGNPSVGAGTDNGSTAETGPWLFQYGAGLSVLSNWNAQAGYDGCPDGSGVPVSDMRMVMSFSDVDGTGTPTFAVACAHRDPSAQLEFSFDLPGAAPIALVAAPKASIANSVRNAATGEATITVAPPSWAAGFYTDGSTNCDPATVAPQFDVYKQTTARGTAPGTSNDAGVGWTLVQTCASSGSPACTFTTTCGATNCDNYLAVVPHFNSNFTTAEAATSSPARVGVKSTNVQAGPSLAVTPKPRPIKNERAGPKKVSEN